MIIFLGLPKCGTMSFTESFNAAGYKAVHWTNHTGEYVGKLMLDALRCGRKLFSFLSEYNVFTQMDVCLPDKNLCLFPQSDLVELIYRQYPEALFILNYRNTFNHVKSICGWGGLKERLRLFDIIDLPAFIDDHNEKIRNFFSGKDNFIEFNIESDTEEKLSSFIKSPIELVHINKSAVKNILLYGQPGSGKSTLAKLLALRLRHTIVIEGDELRKHSGNLDYTKQGRQANIELAITIALFLNSQHVNTVLALVAPYEYLREKIEERLPGLKRCYLFYDSNITIRGREGFWVEDFELNGDYSINTLVGVNECLDNLYNQVMK